MWVFAAHLSLLVSAVAVRTTDASKFLPSFPATNVHPSERLTDRWWLQLHDTVYHQPVSFLETSSAHDISTYHLAVGSKEAIPGEIFDSLRASSGRFHVFHFPDGAPHHLIPSKDRRESLSSFIQVTQAMNMTEPFAAFAGTLGYTDRWSGHAGFGQLEKGIMDHISEEYLLDMLEWITKLPGEGPNSRAYNSPKIGKVVDALAKKFESIGPGYFKVCRHGTTDTNVVAFLDGDFSAGTVSVVGAHYDSRPFGGEEEAPGAVDNGSGAAGVLAIAAAFAALAVKPQQPMYFLLFGGEEEDMVGSKAFVEDLASGKVDSLCMPTPPAQQSLKNRRTSATGTLETETRPSILKIMSIIMDEVAWLSPNAGFNNQPMVNFETYDKFPAGIPDLCEGGNFLIMDTLNAVAKKYQLGNGAGKVIIVVHSPNPFGSDHRSFLDLGYCAVLLIQGDDAAYPFYHKSTDTIGNVDHNLFRAIVAMNAGASLRLAGHVFP